MTSSSLWYSISLNCNNSSFSRMCWEWHLGPWFQNNFILLSRWIIYICFSFSFCQGITLAYFVVSVDGYQWKSFVRSSQSFYQSCTEGLANHYLWKWYVYIICHITDALSYYLYYLLFGWQITYFIQSLPPRPSLLF